MHTITFVYPVNTKAVTVTGSSCSLECKHCRGHYLKHMACIKSDLSKYPSLLMSGGCDTAGQVPLMRHYERLKALSKDHELNLHVGFVNEDDAKKLKSIANVISFDFVVDEETIREVYGLKKTKEDYIKTIMLLMPKVIPHITIGLLGGKIQGEQDTLDELRRLNFDTVVLNVLIPTEGTAYENVSPPEIEDVIKIVSSARRAFANIYIGCMRPGGKYREELDCECVKLGVDKIVNPAPKAVTLAKELGYKIKKEVECCAL